MPSLSLIREKVTRCEKLRNSIEVRLPNLASISILSSIDMQDFFFVGIIAAIALGVLIFKSVMFVVYIVNLKHSNEIINKNLARHKLANHQAQQIQKTVSSIENVVDWKVDDPRMLSEDLRQQFLMKTRTRRTPTSDRYSPRERIPLATTDFDEAFDEEQPDAIPIYTYNPGIGGTQV